MGFVVAEPDTIVLLIQIFERCDFGGIGDWEIHAPTIACAGPAGKRGARRRSRTASDPISPDSTPDVKPARDCAARAVAFCPGIAWHLPAQRSPVCLYLSINLFIAPSCIRSNRPPEALNRQPEPAEAFSIWECLRSCFESGWALVSRVRALAPLGVPLSR